MVNLTSFNNKNSINESNYEHFMRSWGELESASENPTFLSTDKVGDIAYSFERENKIQVGLINIDFSYINPTALEKNKSTLKIANNRIERISNKDFLKLRRSSKPPIEPTYLNKHLFIASPLNSQIIYSNQPEFEFGKLILDKSNKRIKVLQVSFEEGRSYNVINNGALINKSISPKFKTSGVKKIKFIVTFSDNSKLTTYASFYLKTKAKTALRSLSTSPIKKIKATKSFRGYDEPSNCGGTCYGEGEYKVFYANGNASLKKPFLVVDGFDPNDSRKINTTDNNVFQQMFYTNNDGDEVKLVEELQGLGYDVIILNFPRYVIDTRTIRIPAGRWGYIYEEISYYRDGGTDYVERNGKVLQALTQKIKAELISNGSSNKIKIAGPSMGALIAQYALADMEKNNEDHYTDLFISFDGPHKGANAPIGMQKALEYFATGSGVVEDRVNDYANLGLDVLKSPAAKQMLINHYLSNTSGLPQGAPNFRNRFQNMMDNLGFPSQTKNVAVVNGSIVGNETASGGQNMIKIHFSAITGFIRRDLWLNYSSTSGQNTVFRFLKKNWWGANTQADIQRKATSSSAFGSLDNAPGGIFSVKERAEEALGQSFPLVYVYGISNILAYHKADWLTKAAINIVLTTAYANVTDNFNFVPVKSALAYNGTNSKWNEQIGCRNLVCTNETPFDSYYAPVENQEHASLHNDGINWLKEELLGNEPSPSIYNTCNTQSITINGTDRLCNNQIATYSINNCSSSNITWTTSSNLQTISSNNQQIVVKNINANASNSWVRVTLPNGQSVSKSIIGKPSISYTVTSGSYPSISINGVGTSIYQQGIYNTQWVKNGGTGQIQNNNSFTTYASGYGSNWYVSGNVIVTNSCGSTTKSFFISGGSSTDPCESGVLRLEKVASNQYQLIEPCEFSQLRKTNLTIKAELYNTFGIKKNILVENNIINLKNNPKGSVMILRANVKGKIISKMIIID
ncbi:hypothetical protein [Polaribacter sp.]|uniref:hypothetical protein n=1 Tax=Polaribacter sp. TaxID=1920175 RepID=UPI003EF8E3EE